MIFSLMVVEQTPLPPLAEGRHRLGPQVISSMLELEKGTIASSFTGTRLALPATGPQKSVETRTAVPSMSRRVVARGFIRLGTLSVRGGICAAYCGSGRKILDERRDGVSPKPWSNSFCAT